MNDRSKYIAEACRTLGLGFVAAAFLKDFSAPARIALFFVGLAMIVIGWFFVPKGG